MKASRTLVLGCLAALCTLFSVPGAVAQTADTILPATDAAKILPDAVYFAGRSATTQLRNATGVHFADGAYTLAVLVDTSGYSSAIQQKYQAYLLTGARLDFAGHQLSPGAYGFGFVANHFVVMDIGSNDLLRVPSTHDAQLQSPRPLQMVAGAAPGQYRLCSGRDCVDFHRAR